MLVCIESQNKVFYTHFVFLQAFNFEIDKYTLPPAIQVIRIVYYYVGYYSIDFIILYYDVGYYSIDFIRVIIK